MITDHKNDLYEYFEKHENRIYIHYHLYAVLDNAIVLRCFVSCVYFDVCLCCVYV